MIVANARDPVFVCDLHGKNRPTLNASALRDPDGTVIGAIGILRDMRAYEEVMRDLEESRRELRTPLTAMLGWARLWNLLSDAIKFSANESKVSLRLERDGSEARITVADGGLGIEPELLPEIGLRPRGRPQPGARGRVPGAPAQAGGAR